MGWFDRLFGGHKDDAAPAAQAAAAAPAAAATQTAIPPERRGPDGNYDQSGLAKRVCVAFDTKGVPDAPHLYVAQTGTTVVLKGRAPSQAVLDQLVVIARGVDGAQDVDATQVTV